MNAGHDGKNTERIICVRIKQHVKKNYRAWPKTNTDFKKTSQHLMQYNTNGCREKCNRKKWWVYGSKEYCAVVTFHVRNAFNSAYWPHIKRALEIKKTPMSENNFQLPVG